MIISNFPGGGKAALNAVSIKTAPAKLSYWPGESFEPAGLVLTLDIGGVLLDVETGYTWMPETIGDDTEAVTISYTAGGKTVSTAQAITCNSVDSVTLSVHDWTITTNDYVYLTATVLPEDASDKTVTWTSNNPTVAKVTSTSSNKKYTTGWVKPLNTGTTIITASCGDKSDSCIFTVQQGVDSVTLNTYSLTGEEGEYWQWLTATVSPSDAVYEGINWETSDENVVVAEGFDTQRTVFFTGAGTATITVTAGGKSAVCSVVTTERQE